ncbi:MAG: inositol monophosphatase [Actinomycetota bacterium]
MDDDLQLGLRIANDGATLALTTFGQELAVTRKDDDSPVTAADLAVEELIRADLAEARPDDAVLGEEFGLVGSGDRVWIIDPIDGTRSYASGDPNWRVQIALAVADRITVAVVISPALGIQWWATKDGGAFEAPWPSTTATPKRLAVSTVDHLTAATADAFPARDRPRLVPLNLAPRSPFSLADLVRGKLDVVLAECCAVWDHAPWILLVEEAGGRFTDVEGGRSGDLGGGLYSNAAVHDAMLDHLDYPPTGRR